MEDMYRHHRVMRASWNVFFNVLSVRSFRVRKPSLRTPVGVTIQDRESGAGSVVISATCATTSLS